MVLRTQILHIIVFVRDFSNVPEEFGGEANPFNHTIKY